MTETKKSNWWERLDATGDDLRVSLHQGLMKGVEGVADAGMGAVGFIGGLFSDDFQRTMRKAIEFDATGYLLDQYNDNKYVSAVVDTMTNPFSTLPNAIKLIKGDDDEGRLEEIERKSYLTGNKAGEFVKEATTSIGQMAPGLALSFVPGVGPALSMAYTGVSAGGNSMEGALQQGAGYNNALAYGALSGVTEAAMEKLGGWDFGNPTTFMGKLLAGTKLGAWASKGVGKAIVGAASEGVEELGSGFMDPVNKWVTGVDTDIGANFRKAYEESGKTFLMGATVGSIMQGGQVLGQNISNKEAGRGGAKATRADSSLAYVSESAQNYGKNEALNKKTDKAILQGLTDIGVQMTQMSESERDIYRESLGEYKNAFNEDGSIKQDLVNADVNNEAISRKLKPISATLKHAPISSNEQISEGASQAKSHIEKVLGSKANVVITSDSKETNAFFSPDENVFYINNNSATLNDADSAIKKASLQVSFHEMTHSAEGTKQYNEFVNELANIITDKNAPVEVKKKLGNFNKRKIAAIIDYAEQTKGMSKAQARYTVDTEVIADLSGDLMADDYIVNKLAERNAPLVKKLISRFKGTIKKSATVDSESIKYLKKLVSRFEKALDNAQGGVKISQIGNADDEREEAADSSQQSADSKVDDERKSVSKSEIDAKQIAKYQKELDDWDGKTIGFSFSIGEAPNVISNLKINGEKIGKKQIRIDAAKIRTILKEHNTMTLDIVKQIPDLINNPILIMDSLTQNGRIVLLGEVYDEAGLPVMLVLEPNPKTENRNHIYANVIKVASAYGKGKLQSLISRSTIRYRAENKNRVNNWLKVNRLQLPFPNAQYDSATNSITEKSQKDNSFDENNSKKFSDERKSVKRSYEPGGESSKKITLGMSDAERTEILKNKSIKLSAETNNERIEQAQEKHEFTEESFNLANFADKRGLVIKVGDEFGVFKNYHNEDIELSFQYSKNNAREGMDKQKKQYYDFVKMLSCFDSVIENAVGIEMHNRNSEGYKKDNTLKNMYVLASAFVDGDYIVPVKLEIKEFSDKPSSLYVAIALERISLETIKKDGVVVQEVADSSVAQQVTRPSNISIAEYFKNINPKDESFYKYIPKPFLNGDIDTDERKSVKRSYNPFEDIDDEGNKFVEGEDENGVKILFSMPDFDNPAYEYGHIPDEEPDILETYKAVVSSSTEADLRKRLADATKMKVYARKEAKSAFDEIITERGYFEGLNVKFKGKSRTEIEKMLWNALNSADEGARMGPALDIAEAIITNAVVTENYEMTPELEFAYAITGYLKTHLHNINLDHIKGEIKAKYDKNTSVYAMWARKEGERGVTADQIKAELVELIPGIRIDAINEADIFLEIDQMYRDAQQLIKDSIPQKHELVGYLQGEEIEKLKQSIARDILKAYDKYGKETKLAKVTRKHKETLAKVSYELYDARRMNTLENRVLKKVKKIKDSKDGVYHNATQEQTKALGDIKQLLSKINSREQINRSSTRDIMGALSLWYTKPTKENGLLEGFYSEDMKGIIDYFADYKGEKKLSYAELQIIDTVLNHINFIIENYGKIFRGGKLVDAKTEANKFIDILDEAKNQPGFSKFIFNKHSRNFMDAMAVAGYLDGFDYDGYFSTTVRELQEGLIMQKYHEKRILEKYDAFEREHKKYMKELRKGKRTIKLRTKVDDRNLTIDTVDIPIYLAMDLYMVSKTGNAMTTLKETGIRLEMDGGKRQIDCGAITENDIDAIYKQFTEEDKALIKIMEEEYNGSCRQLKMETDFNRIGFSNVFDGYYYPIRRISRSEVDTNDMFAEMERVSNVSLNKSRVEGAKQKIIVSNVLTKFKKHVNAVTRYAGLSIPISNMEMILNLDVSGNPNAPVSVKSRLDTSEMYHKAEKYFKDLASDVQQVRVNDALGNKLIGFLRGSYAKFALGFNPKVLFTQISSYFASFGELRISSLVKASAVKNKIKDSEVDKYCKLAEVRHYELGATRAMAVTDKIGKVGEIATKPIEFMDRGVIKMLFAACQQEAKARYGLEIGTEENKVKAGEILTDVILKTQQNQLATEQSAAMRSANEITRTVTMFNADSMKILSRWLQTIGELTTLKKRIKLAEANKSDNLDALKAQYSRAKVKNAKYCATIVVIATYMALIGELFKWFYDRYEDDEEGFESFGADIFGNMVGMVPLLRDAYSFFEDGYEVENYTYSMINDVLNSVNKTKDIIVDMSEGKEVTKEQHARNIRTLIYSTSQIFGIPARNAYNFATGIISKISKSADLSIDAIFNEPKDTDLKESYKEAKAKGNVSLAGKSLDLIYKNHDMELSDAVLKKELDRLNGLDITKKDDDKSNYSVIAKRAPETVTIDDEEVELTVKQKNAFKSAYKTAEAEAGKMVRVYRYKKLDSASQSYAIRKIYEYQYSKAEESLTGERARLVYFGDIIGMDKLALILGYANFLKGDKDRKAKITAYIKSMGLISQHASLALRFLGYSDKDNDSKVKNFIKARSSLTMEQKEELLKYLSLDKESEEKKKAEEKEREREKEKERKKKEAQKRLENMFKIS